jgi:ribosomal protein S18 acetylase RimI-like enzyme
MSEFYSLRRDAITDLSALFGFLVGFVGAAPFAYDFLRVGFQTSEIVKGFAYFITITMGAGVLCAIAGLGVGRGLGWFWEQGHRVVRRARGQEFAIEDLPQSAQRPIHRERPRSPNEGAISLDASIRYADNVPADAFAALMSRSQVADLDRGRAAAALERTINIGAWDGDRLVGAVRLLSDGYTWWVVTDIVVDPAYRRRGIGRTLMSRAEASSSGAVTVARVPPGTEGFFRAVDLSQAYEGFVRGAKARLH